MLKRHAFYQKVHAELAKRFGDNFTLSSCDEDARYTMHARFYANTSLTGTVNYGRERFRAKNKQGFEIKTGWWLCVEGSQFFNRDLDKLFDEWSAKKVAELEHQLSVMQKSLKSSSPVTESKNRVNKMKASFQKE